MKQVEVFYQEIGQAIRLARIREGLTQVELAELIGEAAITISRWENAVRHPNAFDLAHLAYQLNLEFVLPTLHTTGTHG